MTIYDDVRAERERAHAKHGDKSMEGGPWDGERRLRILLEEVGEVAKEFNDADLAGRAPNPEHLRTELVQVAAMAAAWADVVPRAVLEVSPQGTLAWASEAYEVLQSIRQSPGVPADVRAGLRKFCQRAPGVVKP